MFSYIHIPFCESKCKYCRFASVGSINNILVEKYISHLINDIKNFKRPDENNSGLLSSIYFWWWTPSILNKNQLEKIINTLNEKFWFEKNIEITLETTPKNLTKENINSWESFWINRISIWVQTLNNKTLKEISRDDKETILNWLENLKSFIAPPTHWGGFSGSISVDFIIWLPYVKSWEILENIKYFVEKYDFIKHISVYMLEDYYDAPSLTPPLVSGDTGGFEKITYPNNWKNLWINEENYLKEYLEIKNYLENRWFFRYELSNFAKSGFECEHNRSYWNHSENVWFWLWSHSFIWGKRYAYKDDFLGYYSWKFEYEEKLNDEDLFLEKVMFWLRTSWITKEIYEKLNWQKISEFIKSWLLEIKNENLCITDDWITLIDKIILEII